MSEHMEECRNAKCGGCLWDDYGPAWWDDLLNCVSPGRSAFKVWLEPQQFAILKKYEEAGELTEREEDILNRAVHHHRDEIETYQAMQRSWHRD